MREVVPACFVIQLIKKKTKTKTKTKTWFREELTHGRDGKQTISIEFSNVIYYQRISIVRTSDWSLLTDLIENLVRSGKNANLQLSV